MKHHKTMLIRGGLFAALMTCTSLLPASQANAFGVVNVINPSLLAQAKNFVSNGQNQIMELNQIKTIEQQQLDAMGQPGTLGSLLGSSGMSSVGSQSDFYANMEKFAFDPCAVNLCQGGDNPVGTTDIEEAKDWAMKNFFAGDILDPETERDLHEVRRRGAINAAVDGMAIATITHNELAGAGQQADALDQVVSASQNLRGDIRANSAIALAAYKVQLQQLAMLTSLVEIEAMDNINRAQLYHEEGGTKFPDAFIESDFSQGDNSLRINVTPPQQGSAGGNGLGGALLSSLSDGKGGIADIISGKNPADTAGIPSNISDLASSIQSGALPSVNADKMTLSTVIADSAAAARTAMSNKGAPDILQNSMSMVQAGMSQGGKKGNTTAMLGLAQTFASTNGNEMLSAALNSGSLAIETQNTKSAISFAQGVLRDLSSKGVTGSYVDHIQQSIAGVESGSETIDNLVLDSAAILSTLGSDANTQVSQILQIDPTGASEQYFQNALSGALESAATASGNADLKTIADTLQKVTPEDIASLRTTMANLETTASGPGAQTKDTSQASR